MASVRFENITFRYGDKYILKDFSLEVEESRILCLVGPSGCGKTTLVRCLLGLSKPEQGKIYVGDRCVFSTKRHINVPAERRGVGVVFQDYAVWPHMTVKENVTYPMRKQHLPKDEISRRADEALKMVNMSEYANHLPSQLSGGQQQRVAIARALMMEPQVLLVDEPTAALDPEITAQIVSIIRELAETNITQVIVTHEVEVARKTASRVVYMENGHIVEFGDASCFANPQTEAFKNYLSH